MINSFREELEQKIRSWAKAQDLSLPEELVLSLAPAHVKADLSLVCPLQIAKMNKKNPLDLAGELAKSLSSLSQIEIAEAASPGFVNLTLSRQVLWKNLESIVAHPESYGRDETLAAQKILIEFVSANPTGPLHLASGRGGALGDSLVRILRRLGHDACAEYYVNDTGNQIQKFGKSLWARRRNQEVPEDGYHGDYVADLAKSFPPEADSWNEDAMAKEGTLRLLKTHQDDMKSFGVSFDRWFRESELHESKALDRTLELLKKRGMVYQKDGATWLGTASRPSPEEAAHAARKQRAKAGTASSSEDDKDRVLIRQDGRPSYFLADIAYHENKYSRGFSELIDILGADHHGYVPRMKASIAALGHPENSFHAIVHQLILLFRGKEPVKMSKRSGEFVRLKEVIDEVGKDACRFFFAQRTPNSHLNFDLELAKKRTSENPVYYCQYVHARICSIFDEAKIQGIFEGKGNNPSIGNAHVTPTKVGVQSSDLLDSGFRRNDEPAQLISTLEERALLVKMAWFPEVLKTVQKELSPHPLANYILELAGLFHPFYEKCRVVDPGNLELSRARLYLCAGVRALIKEGLGLIGVSAPEKM